MTSDAIADACRAFAVPLAQHRAAITFLLEQHHGTLPHDLREQVVALLQHSNLIEIALTVTAQPTGER